MPPSYICSQPVSDCLTIDTQTNSIALSNAQQAFRQAASHGNTASAVRNLLKCMKGNRPAGTVMIIGIGAEGRINTGPNNAVNPNEHISIESIDNWTPVLSQLKGKITEIVFCSCNTGKDGTQLLQAVADITGARASAFTGLIFVDAAGGIDCRGRGEWIHIDPSSLVRPTPEADMQVKLKFDDGYRSGPVNDSSKVSYFVGASETSVSLDGADALRLFRLVEFDGPFETKGWPLAMVTGRLNIDFGVFDEVWKRNFVIYNDLLLQDESFLETFYEASDEFSEALARTL